KQDAYGASFFINNCRRRFEIEIQVSGGDLGQPVQKLGASRALPVADAARRARAAVEKNRGTA
ncbi:MAG: hypothetical protein IJP11_08890, partial [Oscillospiraceae bacterium]|nr:hypothetical protein [Oscillospiraceae bacterium]